MANLGEDATFHLRNVVVGLYGVNDNMSRDWFFSAPLPATVEELALPAQESLNAHWVQLLDDLMEEVKDKNMPRGVRFRDYLREQSIIKGLALVTPEEGFKKWSASSWGGEKIPLTAKQNVYKRMGKVSDLHVIVEKPEDVSLVSFLESPQMVMDTILQAISYPREVGGEKVPMTSLGVPAKTEMVEDMLGRKWITSLWDLPYEDLFVHSSCLPYPKGVACLVDTVPNTSRKLGFFDAIHEGYDEFVVGYDGAVDDWEEYCRLDNRFLPKIFQGSKVLREDSTLSVEMNSFSLHFTSDRIKGDSRIHVHLGFASETLLDETLLLFELFPVNGGKSQYRIQSFYEPGVFSSAKYKAKWTAVTNGSGEFTGKVVNKGDKLIIRKGVESTRKQFLSFSGDPVSKIFATGCFYDVSATEMENDCAGFFDAIIFK